MIFVQSLGNDRQWKCTWHYFYDGTNSQFSYLWEKTQVIFFELSLMSAASWDLEAPEIYEKKIQGSQEFSLTPHSLVMK